MLRIEADWISLPDITAIVSQAKVDVGLRASKSRRKSRFCHALQLRNHQSPTIGQLLVGYTNLSPHRRFENCPSNHQASHVVPIPGRRWVAMGSVADIYWVLQSEHLAGLSAFGQRKHRWMTLGAEMVRKIEAQSQHCKTEEKHVPCGQLQTKPENEMPTLSAQVAFASFIVCVVQNCVDRE